MEIEWDKITAKNVLRFKESVERGEFIPTLLREKLEAQLERTPEQEEILKRAKQQDKLREKVITANVRHGLSF
jgi:hypothetical protein